MMVFIELTLQVVIRGTQIAVFSLASKNLVSNMKAHYLNREEDFSIRRAPEKSLTKRLRVGSD